MANDISITNYYETLPKDYIPHHDQKHFLAPEHPFRMVIAGPSGAGKTNIVMHIINKLIIADHLYIYAKKLDEPLYRELIDRYEAMEEQLKEDAKDRLAKEGMVPDLQALDHDYSLITYSSNIADVISPDELDEDKQNLIIIDDMITESKLSHKVIEDLYIRGRKNNASIIYLSQNYHQTPANIRKNANYVALVKIDNKREINELQKDHASRVTKDEFQDLYHQIMDKNSEEYATTGHHGMHFMLIDKNTEHKPLHIRMDFDHIMIPKGPRPFNPALGS